MALNEYEEVDEFIVEEEIPELIELSPKKRKKREKDNQDYIDKNLMWNALKNYYDKCVDSVTCAIPTDLALMIDEIITQMAHRPNFSGYMKQENWLDDMKGDARVKAFKAVVDKSFSLFTVAPILLQIKSEASHLVYYLYKKAKKSQLASDKAVLFDDVEKCKDAILSGNLKKGNVILLKSGDSDVMYKDGDPKNYTVVGIRTVESEDIFDSTENTIKFKANPFGFYSATIWNCFINRIKKEKQTKKAQYEFQEQVYEAMYAEESWKNVRRQKVIYDDEEDSFMEEVKD